MSLTRRLAFVALLAAAPALAQTQAPEAATGRTLKQPGVCLLYTSRCV